MMKNKLFRILAFLLATAIIYSCGVERKLAHNFVQNSDQRSALVMAPHFVYKENQRKNILDSLGITDKTLFDSVLLANSVLLKDIKDSMFIANYMLGIRKELGAFGFKLYNMDSSDEFLNIDTNAFIINVAQLEIEESDYTKRDDMSYYDTYYYHDHVLNAETVSSWIEISEINPNTKNHGVYFASDMITDDLQGEFLFDYFSNEVKYVYEIDTLKTSDLYDFAYRLGRIYAGYSYDLLLNNYLKRNLPADKQSGKYWRFNPETRTLFYATDDKFIPVDQ